MTCLLLLWQPEFSLQQRTRNYQLEDYCFLPPESISLDETVIIKAGGTVSPKPIGNQCKITVLTENKYDLQVSVRFINFRSCAVTLTLYATTNYIYTCDNYPQSSATMKISGTQVIVDLKKTDPTTMQYSFEISITPIKKPFSPDTTETQPVAAGLIIGVVCGIFFFIVVGAIFIACCYRRAQRMKRLAMYNSSNSKVPLEQLEGQTAASNNYESSPRAKTKLLPEREVSVDESVEGGGGRRPQTLDLKARSQTSRSDVTDSSASSRPNNNVAYEHEDEDPYDVMDGDPKPPKSPFLSALQNNVKFQKSRQDNERDAEDRRNRLSGSSFGNRTPGESNSSIDSRDRVPVREKHEKPLPTVPDNRQLTLAEKRKKMESFRRATRPESFTSDELDGSGEDNLNKSQGTSGSDSRSSKEAAPAPGKANTQHTLRPNRGQEKAKTTSKDKKVKGQRDNEVERAPDSPRSTRDTSQFQKLEDGLRGSKRSNKSPKMAAKGFGHRRNRSTDSRPNTPVSMMRDDDEESVRPLQRTTSRQSLYASRSSLYSRRRRKGSFTESVVSGSTFAHDDIDYYRRSRGHADYDDDGYVEPISRHENDRMFKSLGDLSGRRADKATRATQTLRETATQTGQDESVVVHSKRVVQRKRRSKSLSATGTQTTNKKHRSRSKSRTIGDDSDTGDELKNDKREKSKSRESVKDMSEKPKPKPKPKPRKSQSAVQSESEAPVKSQRKKSKSHDKSEKQKASEADGATEMPQDVLAQPPPGTMMYAMGPDGQPYLVPYGLPPSYSTLPHQQPPVGVVSTQAPYLVNGHGQFTVAPPQQAVTMAGQIPVQGIAQAPPVPSKPRKSNWEMLCELTEKHKDGETAIETGSVASSVFTNNIPTHQVVYPGGGVYPQNGQQQAPALVMIPPNQSHPAHPFVTPSGALYPSGIPLSVNLPFMGPAPAAHPSPSVGSDLSHNSSWDVLTRLTEQQNRLQQIQNGGAENESVV